MIKYSISLGGYEIFCYDNQSTDKELIVEVTMESIEGIKILLP